MSPICGQLQLMLHDHTPHRALTMGQLLVVIVYCCQLTMLANAASNFYRETRVPYGACSVPDWAKNYPAARTLGTPSILNGVDDSGVEPLNMNISFFGGDPLPMYLSPNGYISLGVGVSSILIFNTARGVGGIPAIIGYYTTDLDTRKGGRLKIWRGSRAVDDGTRQMRVVIVDYDNVKHYSSSYNNGSLSGQIEVWENGTIIFRYTEASLGMYSNPEARAGTGLIKSASQFVLSSDVGTNHSSTMLTNTIGIRFDPPPYPPLARSTSCTLLASPTRTTLHVTASPIRALSNTGTDFLTSSSSNSANKTCSTSPTSSNSFTYSQSLSSTSSINSLTSEGSSTHSSSPSDTAIQSHSKSLTSTTSAIETASISESFTCLGIDEATDTCSVLRPLPVEWHALSELEPTYISASWKEAKSCQIVSIPFDLWKGRPGAMHTLSIAAMNPRVPLFADLPTPTLSNELISTVSQRATAIPLTLLNTSNASFLSTVNSTFLTAIAIFRYDGKATLNKVEYRINCSAWTRCPVAVATDILVTLEASQRLLPVAVAEATKAGTAILSFAGGLTISPTAVAQLGVATSLKKISRCVRNDLSEDSDDGSYDDYAEGTLNPFGISIGGGGGRRYIRGALVMCVVYAAVLSALMFLFSTAIALIQRLISSEGTKLRYPLAGYPSGLVAVASFVLDGFSAAGTVLGVDGEGIADVVLGWACVALCVAYIGHIVFTTTYSFPPSLQSNPNPTAAAKYLPLEEPTSATASPTKQHFIKKAFAWLTTSTHQRWSDDNSTNKTELNAESHVWMERYESYIADVHVRWYCGLEQGVALAMCVLGATSLGDTPLCLARGSICTLLMGGQCLVMILLQPVVFRWRWLLLSTVLLAQTASAALSVANIVMQEPHLELAMDCLGTAVFLLLGVASVSDMLLMFWEQRESAKRAITTIRHNRKIRKQKRRAASMSTVQFQLDTYLLDVDSEDGIDDGERHSEIPTISTAEQAMVKLILLQLDDYTERLEAHD